MADITVTAANVEQYTALEHRNEIRSRICAATITAGQAVYYDTNGKANVADADSATLRARQFDGVALESKLTGEPIRILERGWLSGYTLTNQAYGAPIYLSATAGAFADAADPNGGTIVGYVDWRNDAGGTFTKVLRVDKAFAGGVSSPLKRVELTVPSGATIHAAASGIVNLWTNPEAGSVLISRFILYVSTIATAACTVAVGTTASTSTTSSNNLLDGLDVHTATGVFDNTVSGGTAGKGGQVLATGKWITLDEASGDATGLVARAWIEYYNI